MALSTQLLEVPSALLVASPLKFVPLFAVSSMSLQETYFLPPVGTARERMRIRGHDDTINLSGLLIGPTRFAQKILLEEIAAGGGIGSLPFGGAILVTTMTIRTDMHVQSLTFNVTAARRQVIEVAMSLQHVPRPKSFPRTPDAVFSAFIGALSDIT